jgi:hypothetical protein
MGHLPHELARCADTALKSGFMVKDARFVIPLIYKVLDAMWKALRPQADTVSAKTVDDAIAELRRNATPD